MSENSNLSPEQIDALLDEAALPERVVQVCLRGDLYAEWEQHGRDIEIARAGADPNMGGAAVVEEIEARRAEVAERMKAATLPIRLRAIPKSELDAIVVKYPPREDNKRDGIHGYNVDSVDGETVRKCIVDPPMSDERWAKLSSKLTFAQLRELVAACDAMHYQPVDVPF